MCSRVMFGLCRSSWVPWRPPDNTIPSTHRVPRLDEDNLMTIHAVECPSFYRSATKIPSRSVYKQLVRQGVVKEGCRVEG